MAKGQRTRASKTSSGSGIKHRRSPQSPQQLILLGKGPMVGVVNRWKIKK